ncbi:O-antigen ligase family protein [Mangrovihabitans endophyticus]|uniref:O-antigen ligase-related domain-containing protein n=1 Tax=Mangrovihabitans endophyticus TaxID=1751298 RepID=A0A8J3C4G3_9ACTN|nr:O-antigen ligase family protein [Mangrovihabitans endophyticus]GGL07974.1 hypothetical protein GCM10012284_48040 [Mangrovihabitans endophyticus]
MTAARWTPVLTGAAAVFTVAVAAWITVCLQSGRMLAAAVPVAALIGVAVLLLALTRFAAYVLVLLAVRPMVDLVKLSGPAAGRADAGGVSRAFDPSTLLAVLFLLAAGLWLAARARRGGGLRVSPLGVSLLLVGATAVVSALGAERLGVSMLEALRILTVVVMFLVLEQLVAERGMARRVLVACFVALALVLAYTAVMSALGHPPAEVKGSFTRISGPFAQSTTLGRFLMFLLIFGAAVHRHVAGRARPLLGVLLAVAAVVLLLTNTRGAILAAALGLLVVAAVRRSARLLLAVGLAGVLALAALPAVGARFAQLGEARAPGGAPTGNTWDWRLDYWGQIVSLAGRNPVTGIGPNMTQSQTAEAKKPHNDILRAYVETGVLGLAAYLAMLVLMLRAAASAVRRAPPDSARRGAAIGFLGCAVAFVAVSAVSNVLSNVATLWYLMAFAAVALAAGASATGAPATGASASRRQAAAPVAARLP